MKSYKNPYAGMSAMAAMGAPIDTFANTDQKRTDSLELVELMQKVSGYPPKMWGPTMIGFGSYHYKSER
ncbi:MAG: hypothetical protein EOM69_10800, partial [Clostridia bacterium]|nr:hypothetical protein [Clostridia bacterium]